MAEPWETDRIVTTNVAPARPTFRVNSPTQPRKDALAIQGAEQGLEIERARLANENTRLGLAQQDQALQNTKANREAAEIAARGGANTTESERNAGFLATRVGGGIEDLQRIGGGADKAPSLSEALYGKAGMLGNYGLEENRQRINNAQRDILDAALTLGTGAAYTSEQIDAYRQSYFPQPGDTEGTVDDKKRRLLRLLEASKLKAGAAAPMIDKAISAFSTPNIQVGAGANTQISDTGEGQFSTDADKGYQAELAQGLKSGAIKDVNDVNLLAAKYGFGQNDPNDPRWKRLFMAVDKGLPYAVPVPTSGKNEPSIAGVIAGSPVGQIGGMAANALTAGTLDELAGVLGGDAERVQEAKDAVRAASPGYALTGDLIGGGAQVALAGGLGGLAPAGIRNAFAALAPATQGALGGGAAAAAYGAGENNDNRILGALLSGALGAGAGGLGGRLLGGRGGPGPDAPGPSGPTAREIAEAAAAEGVPVNRAMLDPSLSSKMGFLESTPTGNRTVNEGLDATQAAIEGRVNNLGGGGTVRDVETLGDTIADAGRNALSGERRRMSDIYTRANDVSRGVSAETPEAVGVIDRAIAQLGENPNANATKIANLNRIRSDFVDADGNLIPKSIASVRDLRTTLRDAINDGNLTMTRDDKLASDIANAASSDMKRTLDALPGADSRGSAASLFKQADDGWRAISQEQEQVWDKLLGPANNPRNGSQIVASVKALAKDDATRLRQVWDRLSPNERIDAAATIASQAGRRTADDPFSVDKFITWVGSISPDQRTIMFGPEGARSIANLRTVAQALKDSTKGVNRSRSGVVGNFNNTLRDWMTGGGVFGSGGAALGAMAGGGSGATTAGLGAAALGVGTVAARNLMRLRSAKAMMNPDLTRWMAASARANTPDAVNRQIASLTKVAKNAGPTLGRDIQQLQQILAETYQGVARSAASDGEPQEGQ